VILRNRSTRPDDDVRRLIAFGLQDTPTDDLLVSLTDIGQGGMRGATYRVIPRRSRYYGMASRLITLGIDVHASAFPCDNLRTVETKVRYVDIPRRLISRFELTGNPVEIYRFANGIPGEGESVRLYDFRKGRLRVATLVKRPYGGLRAPIIRYHDWREALVALTAHEGRHVQQFIQHPPGERIPHCEADAEGWSLVILNRYRASLSRPQRAAFTIRPRQPRVRRIPSD
jgi:hypothetical protein